MNNYTDLGLSKQTLI
jgi:hypothetical protein